MKKTNRKLIPAVAMLLISAIMLSTSSFAWFSINKEVTATNMQVKAVADTSLLISGPGDNGAYSNIGNGNLAETALEMQPCTSANGVKFAVLNTGVKVTKSTESKATWTGGSGAFQSSDLKTQEATLPYVAEQTFKLKSVGGNQTVYVSSLTANVESAGTNTDISKAIRVAITIDSETFVFNPNSGSITDTGAGSLSGETWSLAAQNVKQPGQSTAAYAKTIGKDPVDAVVRIWFEGQDKDCFTDNVNTSGYDINIVFKGVDAK